MRVGDGREGYVLAGDGMDGFGLAGEGCYC